MTPSTDPTLPLRFTATAYRLAMNYCLDVPIEVSGALAGKPPARYVRVAGRAAGQPFRTRLTPRGGGAYRLFLDAKVRAAAGIGLGDAVAIELARADAVAEPALPEDLRAALEAIDGGLEGFAALTEAQRTGMLAFLDRARTPPTRAQYIARLVDEVRRRRPR
ncbi:MAG: YdeI/OmpD-associated family protein [Chloroflexi bacterium]|nr:YdeI/OmpD-associated family protein [Chloroflexota bacterium]